MSQKLESLREAGFLAVPADQARAVMGGMAAAITPVVSYTAHTFLGDGTVVTDYVLDDQAGQPVVA